VGKGKLKKELVMNALLGDLHQNISRICEFALNTGMRIQEILQLREEAIQQN